MNDLDTARFMSTMPTNAGNGTPRARLTRNDSWFEEMAVAWGDALDNQASRIVDQSEKVSAGFDTPAEITALTAESLRMNFVSNSSHTALTAVGTALETLARKQ